MPDKKPYIPKGFTFEVDASKYEAMKKALERFDAKLRETIGIYQIMQSDRLDYHFLQSLN